MDRPERAAWGPAEDSGGYLGKRPFGGLALCRALGMHTLSVERRRTPLPQGCPPAVAVLWFFLLFSPFKLVLFCRSPSIGLRSGQVQLTVENEAEKRMRDPDPERALTVSVTVALHCR